MRLAMKAIWDRSIKVPGEHTLETWLRERAVPASDAIKADPERAVSMSDMRAALKAAYGSAARAT